MQPGGHGGSAPRAYDERKWLWGFLGILVMAAFCVATVIAPEHFTVDSWRGPRTPTAARRFGVIGAMFMAYMVVKSIRYRRANTRRSEP